jgi:hypothetical protein
MSVKWTKTNGLTIARETFGARTDPPILLIMGLSSQMVSWPDSFCHRLTQEGFFVLRVDTAKLDCQPIS